MATERSATGVSRCVSPLSPAMSPHVATPEAMWGLTPGQVWPTNQPSRTTARRGFRKRS
jgi:hypothetical protein